MCIWLYNRYDLLLLLETLAQTKTINSTRQTGVFIQQYKVDWCVSGYTIVQGGLVCIWVYNSTRWTGVYLGI